MSSVTAHDSYMIYYVILSIKELYHIILISTAFFPANMNIRYVLYKIFQKVLEDFSGSP